VGKVPWGHWQRLTVIGALGLDGVAASMSIAAATSAAVFVAFVEQVLIPALRGRPDAIVVMDNLPAHKAARVRAACEAAKIKYRYLPAYSPDLNPSGVGYAGSDPDGTAAGRRRRRALLVEAQAMAAGKGGPDPRGARDRTRPSPGHDHHPGRPGMVPPLRLCRSQLT